MGLNNLNEIDDYLNEYDPSGEPRRNIIKSLKFKLGNFILNFLGINEALNEYSVKVDRRNDQLRADMRLLYRELDTNINQLNTKIVKIKPIIKIDSPEAEAFMKKVLSTQDKRIETQQLYLETKNLELNQLISSVHSVRSKLEQDIADQKTKYELIIATLSSVKLTVDKLATDEANVTN